MNQFFMATEAGAGPLQRQQALEVVQNNILWVMNREMDILENLFVANN